MKSSKNWFQKKHAKLLCWVTLFSLTAHIAFIYFLQGMPLISILPGFNEKKIQHVSYECKENLKERTVTQNRAQELNDTLALFFQKQQEFVEDEIPKLNDKNPEVSLFEKESSFTEQYNPLKIDKIIDKKVDLDPPKVTSDDSLDLKDIYRNDSRVLVMNSVLEGVNDVEKRLPNIERGEVIVDKFEDIDTAPGLKVGINLEPTGICDKHSLETVNAPVFLEKKSYLQPGKKEGHQKETLLEAHLQEWLPIGQSQISSWDVSSFAHGFLPDIQKVDQQIASIANTDNFNVLVSGYQDCDDKMYYMKIAFVPKEESTFKRIKQNIVFLIDRSHSISEEKYTLSKEGVKLALDCLYPGDRFNLVVFDQNVKIFAKAPLEWSCENVLSAKQFLDDQEHGGFFASTDLYASLKTIIPVTVESNEVNTVILLSDGDTFLSLEKQRNTIKEWTIFNDRKVSLYAIAAGEGNNLALLDLLSSFNKGMLAYAQKLNDIPQLIQNVVRVIQMPIGKDIQASAFLASSGESLTVFPQNSRLPDLYQHIPYVLYLRLDKLADFHVFIQGRYYDKWFDLKYKLVFSDITLGSEEIKKHWWTHKAFDYYQSYLLTGKIAELKKAQSILKSYDLPVAFR